MTMGMRILKWFNPEVVRGRTVKAVGKSSRRSEELTPGSFRTIEMNLRRAMRLSSSGRGVYGDVGHEANGFERHLGIAAANNMFGAAAWTPIHGAASTAPHGTLPQLPGYAVFNAHTSYQIGKQLQVYGLVQNIFNQHYYTYGGLFETGALPHAAPYLTDPRSLGPAMPFAVYAGLKLT